MMYAYEEQSMSDIHIDSITAFLQDIGQYPLLQENEERELVRQIHSEDAEIKKQARLKLMLHNLRLVVFVARKYAKASGVPLADLCQEGFFGLYEAVCRFNPSRGTRFATFAVHWIRQQVRLGASGSSSIIPSYMYNLAMKVKRTQNEAEIDGGQTVELEKIARSIGCSDEQVKAIVSHICGPLSLDAACTTENGHESQMLSFVSDRAENNTEEQVMKSLTTENIYKALRHLPKREADIILHRFGFIDGTAKTLEETGKVVGLTRERVRQLEEKALGKLKHPAIAKYIKDECY